MIIKDNGRGRVVTANIHTKLLNSIIFMNDKDLTVKGLV